MVVAAPVVLLLLQMALWAASLIHITPTDVTSSLPSTIIVFGKFSHYIVMIVGTSQSGNEITARKNFVLHDVYKMLN